MGTVTRPGRFACLRWTCDPAWRATYQPKSRTRTRSASLPVMRGALGMVEVESLLSVVVRDTATPDRAVSATPRSTAVRLLAVLQIQGEALPACSDGGRHAAREPGHQDTGRLLL